MTPFVKHLMSICILSAYIASIRHVIRNLRLNTHWKITLINFIRGKYERLILKRKLFWLIKITYLLIKTFCFLIRWLIFTCKNFLWLIIDLKVDLFYLRDLALLTHKYCFSCPIQTIFILHDSVKLPIFEWNPFFNFIIKVINKFNFIVIFIMLFLLLFVIMLPIQ